MQSEPISPRVDAGRVDALEAHPLSELLACPAETGILLTSSAQSVNFDAGQTIFRQGCPCEGLYLVVSGLLMRRTERRDTRIVLGNARPGDMLELASALGDPLHTFSLIAQTQGSLLLLTIGSLHKAFQHYPPLRMRLLEELAREVSRGYRSTSQIKTVRSRRSPRAVVTG